MTENKARVLIVDDEKPIRKFLSAALGSMYHITEAENCSDAVSMAAIQHPDLILLDMGLPDGSGVDVTSRIREWSQVPILILSVRDDEVGKVSALDAGADDYITKPFGTGELMARIRVALRRTETALSNESIYEDDTLRIDLSLRQVFVQGQSVSLTPNEYDLLKLLLQHQGKVLTHHFILTKVWGDGYAQDNHILQVNISNLRKKIEVDPSRPAHITTDPGIGYRFRPAN